MKRILICFAILALTWAWHSVAGAVGGSFTASTSLSSQGDALYVNIANENDIFELDGSLDVMPSVSGKINAHFEQDSAGDIQPKDQDVFSQDASGDYQPVE